MWHTLMKYGGKYQDIINNAKFEDSTTPLKFEPVDQLNLYFDLFFWLNLAYLSLLVFSVLSVAILGKNPLGMLSKFMCIFLAPLGAILLFQTISLLPERSLSSRTDYIKSRT
mmetsp:Transcript_10691/g.9248  ORF Transcript_10691/g.9248 Transcript_10691/m.9248 type:complete len:112 (+) Transcript_10691:980-1315(+)